MLATSIRWRFVRLGWIVVFAVLLGACGGGEGGAPPEPAVAPLTAVASEWGRCFADPEKAFEGVSVIREDEPPHDMRVILTSGEEFRVPAGDGARPTPANEAARVLAAECDQ